MSRGAGPFCGGTSRSPITVYIFSRKNRMPEGYGIAGSELYVYDGLGHGLFEEAKDFYDRVYAFCRA